MREQRPLPERVCGLFLCKESMNKKASKKMKVPEPVKDIDEMTDEEARARLEQLKRRKLELLIKCKEYDETHKIETFKPLTHQKQFYDHVLNGKKTVMMVGANRIGKTVGCINLIGSFMLGCKQPWDGTRIFPSDRAREADGKGVVGRILCKDWEKSARAVIIPALKEWLPVGTYETRKNNVGVEFEWFFPATKSHLTICTYNEDTMSQMGWKGDFVHGDEPPPRDKYIANRRGLIDYNGVFTIAMTAIDEFWILDEIVLQPDVSTGIVADVPIQANTYLTDEAIRIFESGLSEDEKIAMIKGGWLQLTGRIWKCFDPNVHIVKPFPIPPDWPVEFQIDFHLDIPHAISFAAVDKYNRYFVCDEIWQNLTNEDIANEIIRRKNKNVWNLRRGEIDALSKGDSSYVKNRYGMTEDSYTVIQKKLAKYGIMLGVGSKDEKSYIKAVEARLKGSNGPPTLYFFEECKETIKQVQRWAYDDNHRPRDDGHFAECIGRFTQSGLRYVDPTVYTKPIEYARAAI